MLTKRLSIAVLGGLLAVAQLGCHACQSCHDYGSPVSGAACGACHHARAGSYASMASQEEAARVAGDTPDVR
ncbi:MAG: hypothetical protein AAFV43_15660 [Planctomycetota bacterium]